MTDKAERVIGFDDEMFSALRAAVNIRELDDVDFDRVQQALPSSMNPAEVKDVQSQFIDRVFEVKSDWDGSVRKLNARTVYTIGLSACSGGDLLTAKSAEKVAFGQGPPFGWLYGLSIHREISRRTP